MNRVEEYLQAHQEQTRDAVDVIEEFGDEIAEMHGKCLDIGCGPATITREIFMPRLPNDATVVGMDVSKRMIDSAKAYHKDEKRLSFLELNVEADKLPADQVNAYDNVVSFYCLNWCEDLRKACKNIFNLLRPGGNALLMFMSFHNYYDSCLAMHKDPRYKPYMEDVSKFVSYFKSSKFPRASFKKMLQECGFEVIHCSVREKCFNFQTAEDARKHAEAVDPFIDRMPDEIEAHYRSDIWNDLRKRSIWPASTDNESTDKHEVLDIYKHIIAYIRKPSC